MSNNEDQFGGYPQQVPRATIEEEEHRWRDYSTGLRGEGEAELARLRAEVERLTRERDEARMERDDLKREVAGRGMRAPGLFEVTKQRDRLAAALRRLLGWVEDLHDDDSCIAEAQAALAEVENVS